MLQNINSCYNYYKQRPCLQPEEEPVSAETSELALTSNGGGSCVHDLTVYETRRKIDNLKTEVFFVA